MKFDQKLPLLVFLFQYLMNYLPIIFWFNCSLIVEQIPKHLDYKLLDNAERNKAIASCKRVLPIAEELKQKLLRRYDKEYQLFIEAEQVNDIFNNKTL